jgi:transcriptional regulator with XRE-family HTH domain
MFFYKRMNMTYAEKLKELRAFLGLSQVEMGKRLGVTIQAYRWWEHDSINPRPEKKELIDNLFADMQQEKKRKVA